jgi:methylenetetrahydrofolate--tRNA-(uracil-5-)-methyltransferase
MPGVTIVGAGLAGCEAAWQLAERGSTCDWSSRSRTARTAAQSTDAFCELVCSNSLRGASLSNAVGLLKEELRRAGSLVLACADITRVPAGGALAVDRDAFSATHHRAGCKPIDASRSIGAWCIRSRDPTGSPVSPRDRAAHRRRSGRGPRARDRQRAPGVLRRDCAHRERRVDRLDARVQTVAVRQGSRAWGRRGVRQLSDGRGAVPRLRAGTRDLLAQKVEPRTFEDVRYFEGCLPIEVMASRGEMTLAFGPMKPVGLTDPRTGRARSRSCSCGPKTSLRRRTTWSASRRG